MPRWFGLADTSTAGMMTVVAGVVVAVALVAAPERGLAARALHRVRPGRRRSGGRRAQAPRQSNTTPSISFSRR